MLKANIAKNHKNVFQNNFNIFQDIKCQQEKIESLVNKNRQKHLQENQTKF